MSPFSAEQASRKALPRLGPNELLRMWPVSKRANVSGRGDDDPSLIEPVGDDAIAEGQRFKRLAGRVSPNFRFLLPPCFPENSGSRNAWCGSMESLLNSIHWLVGATGIEPVTPPM